MLPSLKCIQATGLGSEHMAGSWAREAGASNYSLPVPELSGAVATGGQSPSSIPPLSNQNDYVIIMSFRIFHAHRLFIFLTLI